MADKPLDSTSDTAQPASEPTASSDESTQEVAKKPSSADELAELNRVENEFETSYTGSEPDTQPIAEANQRAAEASKNPLMGWFTSHKKATIISGIVALIAILGVVTWLTPLRYVVMNLFAEANIQIVVKDAKTNLSVPKVSLELAGQSLQTDDNGVARLAVDYGPTELRASRAAYQPYQQAITIDRSHNIDILLTPTGVAVKVKVANKLSGEAISGAIVQYGEAESRSGSDGVATIQVTDTKTPAEVEVRADGYNSLAKQTITPEAESMQTLTLTPAGSVYALVNQDNRYNVVRSDLDGENKQIIVTGTGRENAAAVALYGTTDWKYLMLLAKRDESNVPGLYMINTESKAVSRIEPGDATITPQGWSGHRFVYTRGGDANQTEQVSLRTYDADNKKTTTIDQIDSSNTSSSQRQQFTQLHIEKDRLVYGKFWSATTANQSQGQQEVISIGLDGGSRTSLVTYPSDKVTGLTLYSASPTVAYVSTSGEQQVVSRISDGKLEASQQTPAALAQQKMLHYLTSPSGTKSLWSDAGNLTIGDANSDNKSVIAPQFQAVGWISDSYVVAVPADQANQPVSKLHIIDVKSKKTVQLFDAYIATNRSAFGYGGFSR